MISGRERVAAVTEAFGDYEPLDAHHFSVPPPSPASLLAPAAALPEHA